MRWVGQMLVLQCKQSNRALPPTPPRECCVNGKLLPQLPCDKDGLPDFGFWGFTFIQTHQVPLSWSEAVKEINECRPFVFSRTYTGPGASVEPSHMMVVVGYETDGVAQRLLVLDPVFDKPAIMMSIAYDEDRKSVV